MTISPRQPCADSCGACVSANIALTGRASIVARNMTGGGLAGAGNVGLGNGGGGGGGVAGEAMVGGGGSTNIANTNQPGLRHLAPRACRATSWQRKGFKETIFIRRILKPILSTK